MSDDEPMMPFPEAKAKIQKQYIDRVFDFMNKKRKDVAKPKEFIAVVEIVMKQCDDETHSKYLHQYFQEQLTDYIKRDLIPYFNNQRA